MRNTIARQPRRGSTVVSIGLVSALLLLFPQLTVLASGLERAPARQRLASSGVERRQLRVRLHSVAPTLELPIERVADEVRAIWVAYLDIVVTTGAGETTTFADEVHVRIGSDPPPIGGALAWIRFEHGVPTREIVASLPETHALLQRSSWRIRRVYQLTPALTADLLAQALGRAIAHEIGHYVLRSSRHEAVGLMRERLSAEDAILPRGDRFRVN